MKHEALCWVAVFLAKKVQSYLQTSFAIQFILVAVVQMQCSSVNSTVEGKLDNTLKHLNILNFKGI